MSGRKLVILFILALALRCGAWLVQSPGASGAGSRLLPDEAQYWGMAGSLARGEGLRDELGFCAGRMPLLPAMLAPFTSLPHGLACARLLLCVIGSCVPLATATLGARHFGPRIGWVAGLMTAADPYLVYFSSLLLTETPFLLALVLFACLAMSPITERAGAGRTAIQGAAWGLSAAACTYLREAGAAFVVVFVAWSVVRERRRARAVLRLTVTAAVVFLALLPWALRNRQQLGAAVFMTTRGGITLYDGVHAGATGRSDLGDIKNMPAVSGFVERGDELGWDRWFRQAAWRSITDDFSQILRLALVKLKRTWNVIPNLEEGRSRTLMAVSAIWTIPIYALAMLGVYYGWRGPRAWRDDGEVWGDASQGGARPVVGLLLPALVVTLLHALLVGSVRYRLPAMPFLEVASALAVVAILDRTRVRRRVGEMD